MDNNQLLQKTLQTEMGMLSAPTVITGTSTVTGLSGSCFQVLEDATMIESVIINGTTFTEFAAIELGQGFILYGVITEITLSAGSGLVYYGNNNFL